MTQSSKKFFAPNLAWRGVDYITAAMLAVALGVAFWGYDNLIWPTINAITAAYPPVAELQLGVWMLPAVIGAAVVRKPGAALFTELVAASVELLLGNTWGATVFVSAAAQSFGLELVLLLVGYKTFRLWMAIVGAALSAALEVFYEYVSWVPDYSFTNKVVYMICGVISGATLAGAGGWVLVRSLAKASVLNAFRVGREAKGTAPSE